MAKKKTTEIPQQTFKGFPPNLFKFLKELKKNNDRDWFAENKHRYESDIVEPAMQFIAAMAPIVQKLSPFMTAIPKKMGGSVMRIYRDTRFSANKEPYKTNVGIQFRHQLGADVHAPGFYVHLEPGSCFLAVGTWMPPSDSLILIRQAIAETPKDWQKVVNNAAFKKRYRMEGESLKTAPQGYPKDHPMIEDLRRKSFACIAPINQEDLCSAKAIEQTSAAFKDAQPLRAIAFEIRAYYLTTWVLVKRETNAC